MRLVGDVVDDDPEEQGDHREQQPDGERREDVAGHERPWRNRRPADPLENALLALKHRPDGEIGVSGGDDPEGENAGHEVRDERDAAA